MTVENYKFSKRRINSENEKNLPRKKRKMSVETDEESEISYHNQSNPVKNIKRNENSWNLVSKKSISRFGQFKRCTEADKYNSKNYRSVDFFRRKNAKMGDYDYRRNVKTDGFKRYTFENKNSISNMLKLRTDKKYLRPRRCRENIHDSNRYIQKNNYIRKANNYRNYQSKYTEESKSDYEDDGTCELSISNWIKTGKFANYDKEAFLRRTKTVAYSKSYQMQNIPFSRGEIPKVSPNHSLICFCLTCHYEKALDERDLDFNMYFQDISEKKLLYHLEQKLKYKKTTEEDQYSTICSEEDWKSDIKSEEYIPEDLSIDRVKSMAENEICKACCYCYFCHHEKDV